MKKPLRGAFIALSIISAVVLLLWAGALAANMIIGISTGIPATDVLLAPFKFDISNMGLFISIIVSYVVALVFLVLLVLAITLIKKRPGAKAVAILLAVPGILLGIYSFCFAFSADGNPTPVIGIADFFGKVGAMFEGGQILPAVLVIASYALAVIALVLVLVTIIIGINYSKKYIAAKQAKREAEIAEEEAAAKEYEAASAPVITEAVEEEAPVEAAVEAQVAPTPVEENANYETPGVESIPVFVPEPEPTMEEEPAEEVEEKKEEPLTASSLASMLREVVREIVQDELRKQPKDERPENDNHSIVGATFGGPLVVQYFNGGIQGVTPAQPTVVAAPVEEKKEEPAPVEEVKEEPKVEEPAPVEEEPVVEEAAAPEVVEEVPVAEPVVEEPVVDAVLVEEPAPVKAPIIRIPFEERITKAEKEMQENYNIIKNEILSYGVKSRVSSSGDTFRLHCKTYVKLTVAGKSLKLYFALDPKDYADSKMPIQDASEKNIYQEIPLVFKVKSGLSLRRCKELIRDAMSKDGLEQGEVESVNWVKELKAEMKERAKAEKAAAKEAEEVEATEDEEE